MRHSSLRIVLVGLAISILAVGACGGDDDDSASSSTTTKTEQTSKNANKDGSKDEDEGSGKAKPVNFCKQVRRVDQAFAGLADGSTKPKKLNKALTNVAKSAPAEIKSDVRATVESTRQLMMAGAKSTGSTTPPTTAAGTSATTWSSNLPADATAWIAANCKSGGGGGNGDGGSGQTTAPTTAGA